MDAVTELHPVLADDSFSCVIPKNPAKSLTRTQRCGQIVIADGKKCFVQRGAFFRQHAAGVLTTHQCTDTTCAVCGQQWPCTAACAAEFVLELRDMQ